VARKVEDVATQSVGGGAESDAVVRSERLWAGSICFSDSAYAHTRRSMATLISVQGSGNEVVSVVVARRSAWLESVCHWWRQGEKGVVCCLGRKQKDACSRKEE
jgi:hypothetical protein